MRASLAERDVRAAVEYVSDAHETVHLVGVSWGTMTGGTYLTENDPDLASATLCAPVYLPEFEFEAGMAGLGLDSELDAYYVERRAEVENRQDPDNQELFEAVWRTQVGSNQGIDDDSSVAQAGALADVKDCCEGTPVYDASEIDVPTLVVRGTEDEVSSRSDALALYDDLSIRDGRTEYTEIGAGDHFVMHGPRRQTLYDIVRTYQDRTEADAA